MINLDQMNHSITKKTMINLAHIKIHLNKIETNSIQMLNTDTQAKLSVGGILTLPLLTELLIFSFIL